MSVDRDTLAKELGKWLRIRSEAGHALRVLILYRLFGMSPDEVREIFGIFDTPLNVMIYLIRQIERCNVDADREGRLCFSGRCVEASKIFRLWRIYTIAEREVRRLRRDLEE